MIRFLQLECITNHTGLSLQTAATLLINEIREITFLMVNGIFYTLHMESTTNLVLVVLLLRQKKRMMIRRPLHLEILNFVELLESYDNFFTRKVNANRLLLYFVCDTIWQYKTTIIFLIYNIYRLCTMWYYRYSDISVIYWYTLSDHTPYSTSNVYVILFIVYLHDMRWTISYTMK